MSLTKIPKRIASLRQLGCFGNRVRGRIRIIDAMLWRVDDARSAADQAQTQRGAQAPLWLLVQYVQAL